MPGACLDAPRLDAARCVHSAIETASCRACVNICPRGAWRLDDEALTLDASQCDGCALCRAACAPAAIDIARAPARREVAGTPALLAACDRAVDGAGAGRVGCLHGIALRDLLREYRAGWRVWLLARGDCDTCPRAGAESLHQRMAKLNAALTQRGQATLRTRELTAATWLGLLAEDADQQAARRGFFQALARRPLGVALGDVSTAEAAPDRTPPGRHLAASITAMMPRAPVITAERCIACHACARVCPEGAIRFTEEAPAYHIDAAACSGCRLCGDVCPREAVRVSAWSPPGADRIDLTARRCPACGVTYHAPAGQAPDKCWICAARPAGGRLYQVMA